VADLRGHDLRCTLPAGWDGRITVRNDGQAQALSTDDGVHTFTARPQPIVHLANFGLPEERGDFGSGAVELMGERDVFVVLFEYDHASAETALFAPKGIPRALAASEFDPLLLRRGIQGQTGYQSFFHEGGRAFCLYVVLGSAARRNALVRLVNAVLPTVRITPRPAG
jgi:hypothetical protein